MQSMAANLAFRNIWSAPMVRSSYFADRQYHGEPVPEVRRKVDPAKKSLFKLSKLKN